MCFLPSYLPSKDTLQGGAQFQVTDPQGLSTKHPVPINLLKLWAIDPSADTPGALYW